MRKEIINTILMIVGSWKYESREEDQYKKIYEQLRELNISQDDFEYLDSVLEGIFGLLQRI